MSKAAARRNFGVKRTTLIKTLARAGEPDLTGTTDVAERMRSEIRVQFGFREATVVAAAAAKRMASRSRGR
jgi:DNA-binding phage protein